MSFKALVWDGSDFEVNTFAEPVLEFMDVLLRVEVSGICGTDRKIIDGKMSVPLPIILGHEIVARVEKLGPGFREGQTLAEGDLVALGASLRCLACEGCLTHEPCHRGRSYGLSVSSEEAPYLNGGFGTHMVARTGSRIFRFPKEVSKEAASFANVLANGIEWVQTIGDLRPGQSCLVLGGGPQALACAFAASECNPGTLVVAGLENDRARLEFISSTTDAQTVVLSSVDPGSELKKVHGAFDLVVEATGAIPAATLAQDVVAPGGTIIAAGLPPEGATTPVDVGRLVWGQRRMVGVLAKSPASMKRAVDQICNDRWPGLDDVTQLRPLSNARAAIDASVLSSLADSPVFRTALVPDL